MDTQQAQQAIRELFTQPFDQARYQHFLRNLLNQFEARDGHYTGNYIPDAFKHHINQYWRIGKYADPDGRELDLLVVEVKSLTKLERARSSLRNFAVNRLKQFEKEASLIAFYAQDDKGADWRFSFIKIEHEAYQDGQGKVKLKQELTPAKRYSYLVGVHENSHTASKQLLPLVLMDYADPRIEEIEAAFSIEKVTGEFFDQYKALFQKLAEHLKRQAWFIKNTEEETDQQVSRFAKKLLGQIVFLYFLQKKGWLGVAKDKAWGTGSKRFMRARHDQIIKAGGNYYRDFLQYLFYEALADERKGQDDPGYYARFDCRVPFLNGGLFEADYDWRNEIIELPNALFHNDEKNKNGDTGTGILDVFDRYNFTIKEDEPLEKEVAVDPEMLGKVFENMLEVTERKSKGAFYTPREIVHYMCQESLIHYLDNRLNSYATTPELVEPQSDMFGSGQQNLGGEDIKVPKTDIETLIRKGHLALENDTRVLAKGKETDTYKFQLPESVRQHAKIIDTALADIKVCDPAIGSGAFPVGLLHEIVNARLALAPHSGMNHSAYDLKRHAIGESLYGVDIDASAIDIARLRLWLSLIVDEEDYSKIEALPNLDYKIVRGNTLIGFPENWKSPAFDKIEVLKKQFFQVSDHDKKAELKNQIEGEIQQRLADSKRVFGWQVDFDFRLFFSEVWHYKGGFDVVIGNPPYVDIKQLPKELVKHFFENYKTAENRINLYAMFIEKGLSICNEQGSLNFINPNSMLLNSSYRKLRKHIVSKLILVIKLPDKMFKGAIVETIIIQVNSASARGPVFGAYYKNSQTLNLERLTLSPFDRKAWINDPDAKMNIFATPEQEAVLHTIDAGTEKFGDVYDFSLGVTPYDKYRGHSEGQIKNRVFHSNTRIDETYVPLISGSNIQPYYIDENNISEYLKYGEWLGAPRQRKFFINPRVIIRQIVSGQPPKIYAGYTEEELYQTQIGFSLLSKGGSVLETKMACVLLNSDVINFYHLYRFLDIEKETFQKILIENCKLFPIPKNADSFVATIPIVLDYIICARSHAMGALVGAFLGELANALVFECYFPLEMRKASKELLQHLDGLKAITNAMSQEQKLAIVQSEFERLYDPRHPVRNCLETIDSVEVVRTIREALQKKKSQ